MKLSGNKWSEGNTYGANVHKHLPSEIVTVNLTMAMFTEEMCGPKNRGRGQHQRRLSIRTDGILLMALPVQREMINLSDALQTWMPELTPTC